MKKRIISAFLVLSIVFTLLPARAFAASSVRATEPTLTALTVQDKDGKTISLLDGNGAATVSLGETYTFKAVFSNADEVQSVYITSTKGNEKAILEASYDQNEHAFISTGFFNDDNKYVPGKIGVEYTKKVSDVKIDDDVDWSVLQTALDGQCIATVNDVSGESVQATVDISKLLNEESGVVVKLAIDVFDETTGGDLNGWLGAYEDFKNAKKYALDGGKYFLYADYSDPATYAMFVHDVSGNKYIKLIVDDIGNTFDSMSEISEKVSQVNVISGLIYDYFDIKSSANSLKNEIVANPNISTSQKLQLNAEVDNYETDRRAFALLSTILSVVVPAAVGTMAGPAIIFNALWGAINAASGTFWDYRVGMIQGCEPIDTNFVSGACGVPLTKDYLIDHDITQSGQYYLPEGAIGIVIGADDEPPVDVTLCLHGQKVLASITVADGSTLHLCDCEYSENTDGSVTGGQVPNVHIGNGSNLIFEGGIIGNGIYGNRLYCNGGNVVIIGGTVTDSVTGTDSSKITVEGGAIRGGISSEDGGEIIIKRGTILGAAHGYGVSLWTDSGSIKILDGQINCGVQTNSGTIRIDDGLIGQSDTTRIQRISNEAGVLELCGGTILGSIYNGEDGVAYISGGEVICTRLNNDNAAGDYKAITNNGGNVTITGGVIKGVGKGTRISGTLCIENCAGGTVNIAGGTFQSSEGICLHNSDELSKVSITNGSFSSLDSVIFNEGTTTIAGGTFRSAEGVCVSTRWGTVTISNGYFQGTYGISDYRSNGNKLLIGSDSVIEINATKAAFHSDSGAKIIVEANVDYKGGVTYYNSPKAQGSKKTIGEASGIDYEQPYVCLVADNATGGPSSGNQGGCEHTYTSTLIAPTCTEQGYTMHTCSKCEHVYKDNYTNALGHTYSGWVITTAPTSTSNGQRERICSRCNNKETEIIPATGSGSSSGGSGSGSSSGGSSSSMNYSINTPSRVTGGTVRISSSSARKGNTVTITVTPNTGFELEKLTVTDSKGNNLKLTDEGNSKFTFTMPASKVSVDASFVKIEETPTQPITPTISFTDVSSSAYYADAVAWAVEKGITVGTSATTFDPDTSCTRAQIVTFLWRAAGSPKVEEENSFSDVARDSYYYDAVQWAVAQGITAGTSADMFSPDAACTRGQTVTFLYRYEKSPRVSGGNAFTDVPSDAYYTNAVQWAVNNGVTSGTSATTFSPNATCTRGQIVTFLYRDMA